MIKDLEGSKLFDDRSELVAITKRVAAEKKKEEKSEKPETKEVV